MSGFQPVGMKFTLQNGATSTRQQQRVKVDKLAQDLILAARAGRASELLPQAKKMMKQYPDHLGMIQGMVEVSTALGDFKSAVKHARRMVELAPTQPMAKVVYSSCLMKMYRTGAAVDILRAAEKNAGRDVKVLSIIGHSYEKSDAMEDALRVFKLVDEIEPDNAYHLQRIAAVYRFLGEFEKAEECCNRSIELKGSDYYVYYLRSGLRKQTPDRNYTEELEALLAEGIPERRDRAHVEYGLAKEYEDLKEYEKSFRHLKAVSDFQREGMEYDINLDLQTMEEIKTYFNRGFFENAPRGHDARDPIFIIGMPRTGTTLVERIIGSHSKVHSLGELGVFGRLLVRSVKEKVGSQEIAPEDRVKLTAQLDYEAVGQRYIEGVADRRGEEPIFIDKLPYNYLNVGPIHAALPNAKIIQLDRHPLDTCYAIYKTLFGSAYPFSYTFEELGAYYSAYRKMIDHWYDVLPEGAILKVRYEDVVDDQEGQTRRIFEHCGLEWEDQVKEFYNSKQSSTTASAAQVRQPVYKSSVAKWRNYEEQLAPLRDILAANGIEGLD